METILMVIGLAIIGGIIFLITKLKDFQKPATDDKMIFEYMEALKKDFREHSNRLDDKLTRGMEHSAQTIQKQFAQSANVIKDVTEKLTKLDETNKQVLGFSEQMQSLENILKNPKQRGILGEYFLETLLNNVLPPDQYKMQYKFANGEIVDAAIFVKDHVIPVDAKFSLEKYNKLMEEKNGKQREQLEKEFKMDVKNRIDETSKYIRPKEDTMDFAFMFIPAEGIYYNLLIYKVGAADVSSVDLINYAFSKHVIIVSPTSFYAYLQTVLQGMKAMKMEESIKEIIKKVGDLGKHITVYDDYLAKLGGHLGTTVNTYNLAYKEFKKIDKDVYRITDGEKGGKIEPAMIDRPNVEV